MSSTVQPAEASDVAAPSRTRRSVAVIKPQEVLTFDQQLLRIAGDPKIPVARLKEIAELRSQIRREDAEEAFVEALRECQAEMRPVEANANNPQTMSKYATLYAVDTALRPIYSKYGFSLSFDTADGAPEGHTRVICYVSRGLHTRRYQYDVAVSTKGAKGNDVMTPTHAGGSAFSYGKRYLELAIFNVTIGDPGRPADDDGNTAGAEEERGPDTVTAAEIAHLRQLMTDKNCPEVHFLKWAKVSRIEEIKNGIYDRCVVAINGYRS